MKVLTNLFILVVLGSTPVCYGSINCENKGARPIYQILCQYIIFGAKIIISITHYNINFVRKLSSFLQKSRGGCSNEEEKEDVKVLGLPYLQML